MKTESLTKYQIGATVYQKWYFPTRKTLKVFIDLPKTYLTILLKGKWTWWYLIC
jgi:hypothetical protein